MLRAHQPRQDDSPVRKVRQKIVAKFRAEVMPHDIENVAAWTFILRWNIAFGCSQVWAQDHGETGFHASLDGEFRYGNIKGFVQIPRGGGAGTTSSERPKFDEIGIDQAAIGAPSVTLGWNNHNIYGLARIIRLSGSDVLE